jgi:hypothetical protein
MTATEKITNHYQNADVRARIEDFLGANLLGNLECHHLIKGNETEVHFHQPHSPEELYSFFEEGAEIFRSLWDRTSLIADLDIEYVNFDHPEKAYLELESIFSLQEPVEKAIVDLLSHYGIVPLPTSQGWARSPQLVADQCKTALMSDFAGRSFWKWPATMIPLSR